ncbi:MAG: cupredoxin domain-containing protein [Vicinamibacterales bacterium]
MPRYPLAVALALAVLVAPGVRAQEPAPTTRAFTVTASNGRFTPERLDVSRNDLVQVTLVADRAPVSFAIDAYRLMKRAGAGERVTFSFRADQAGSFAYYCSLASNPECRTMRGTLVVSDR